MVAGVALHFCLHLFSACFSPEFGYCYIVNSYSTISYYAHPKPRRDYIYMNDSKKEETDFYESYAHLSRTLRAWMVAYGIGFPTILLSQDAIARLIRESGHGIAITVLFLAGVTIQVTATLLYKYSMGYLYAVEYYPKIKGTLRHKIADWLSGAFWLEMTFDVLSIICFLYGTYFVIMIVLDGPTPK